AVEGEAVTRGAGTNGHHPTGIAADPIVPGRAWCCTRRGGVFRSEDAGSTWRSTGLEGENLMSIVASPARRDLLWAGTEPSRVWRSDDAGETWRATAPLETLDSSDDWAFPP